MRPIQPGEVPFTTTNDALAYCLYNAGVPFLHEHKPCVCQYDHDIIEGFRHPDGTAVYEGLSLEEAVRQAHTDAVNGAKGRKGRVIYSFRPVKEIGLLTAAFAAQERELADGTGTAQELKQQIMERFKAGEISAAEALLRSDCITLKMRPEFLGMWKRIVPDIFIQKTGRTQSVPFTDTLGGKRIKGTIVRQPGFMVVPANASESMKRHLKLS